MEAGDGCDVFVFDLDGVLIMPSEEGVKPRRLGISLLNLAIEVGVAYIFSGRPRSERGEILLHLREGGANVGGVKALLLKPRPGIGEIPWKLEAFEEILSTEGCVGEVHDDNPYVLSALRRRVDYGLVLHYDSDSYEVVYGYSRLLKMLPGRLKL